MVNIDSAASSLFTKFIVNSILPALSREGARRAEGLKSFMSFLNLIFPKTCYGCGKSGRYLCLDCQSKLVVRSIKPPQRLALFRYHDPIKAIIHDLKFEFVSDLIPELALLMSRTLKSKFPHLLKFWQAGDYVLVPIPLHPHRSNWRGFNQSEALVKELSPLISLKYENLLVRTQDTIPQTSIKDKLSRHTNITHAFSMIKCLPAGRQGSMKNGKYILVDDVYTTGSTIKSAITCFPKDSDIWILTLA